MPTYEYKCLNCGKIFELFQPMNAEHIKNCPECNGPVKRLIGTGSGPIFKGSGFYQTDYKKKPPESPIKKDDKSKKQEKKSTDKPKEKE
jgi:putative FmdB family regulatory protein